MFIQPIIFLIFFTLICCQSHRSSFNVKLKLGTFLYSYIIIYRCIRFSFNTFFHTIGNSLRNESDWIIVREKAIMEGIYLEAPMEETSDTPVSIFLGGGIKISRAKD